jgi:rubrerythrin
MGSIVPDGDVLDNLVSSFMNNIVSDKIVRRTPMLSFVRSHYLSRLVATPRGRAFLFAFMADAEESDEQGVFDALLARVDDPKLHKLVEKHVADEARHAELLRACALRQGVPLESVPRELRIVTRIDKLLGGAGEQFKGGRLGVMHAYALLQVIEERAVREFPAIVEALSTVDPESSRVVAEITRDEARHVRYAIAISTQYAPDEATLARTLRRMRAAEQRAFFEHRRESMRVSLDRGHLDVGSVERFMWRALAA